MALFDGALYFFEPGRVLDFSNVFVENGKLLLSSFAAANVIFDNWY